MVPRVRQGGIATAHDGPALDEGREARREAVSDQADPAGEGPSPLPLPAQTAGPSRLWSHTRRRHPYGQMHIAQMGTCLARGAQPFGTSRHRGSCLARISGGGVLQTSLSAPWELKVRGDHPLPRSIATSRAVLTCQTTYTRDSSVSPLLRREWFLQVSPVQCRALG